MNDKKGVFKGQFRTTDARFVGFSVARYGGERGKNRVSENVKLRDECFAELGCGRIFGPKWQTLHWKWYSDSSQYAFALRGCLPAVKPIISLEWIGGKPNNQARIIITQCLGFDKRLRPSRLRNQRNYDWEY